MNEGIEAALIMLSMFGGISMVIRAGTRAKIERLRAEREMWQPPVAQQSAALPAQNSDGAVLAELRALKQQVAEMQSTGHQFDISFDAALERMQARVERLETKAAASSAPAAPAVDALRNGVNP